MTEPATTAEHTLRVTKTVVAPREAVWRAWTDPTTLRAWFRPGEEYETFVSEVDLRVGGKYRIGMRHRESGKEHVATGVYREITAPQRLVCTWSWEGSEGDGAAETLVTVELSEHGDDTEVALTHERFPTESMRDDHAKGWGGCLESLAAHLSA